MSLTTPTTKDINDTIIAGLQASLSQTIPLLPKSFLRVLAAVLAGVFVLIYKYAGFSFLQLFVRTASFSETTVNGVVINPLIEWGRLVGVGDPAPATAAQLLIDITVTNQVGSLPAGTALLSSSNGVTYLTAATVLLDAATKQVTIFAAADQAGGNGSGTQGNLADASIVSFANPLPNVLRDTVVDSTVVTGADAESEDAYRQRIIDRFQLRPQGGALLDYVIWGTEPAGILNIYPYTGAVPGEVDLYVESATEPDGIPTPAQLTEVYDATQLDSAGLATRRPVGAGVNAFAITRIGFDVTVSGLLVDNTALVQSQIQTAVEEFYLDAEPFIDGVSATPRRDRITLAALGGMVQDIVDANSGIVAGTTMELTAGGGNLNIYNLGIGEKAKLTGSVAFV